MLKGKKINLRFAKKEDLKELHDIKSEEDVIFNLTTHFPFMKSLESEEENFLEGAKDRRPDNIRFTIENKKGKAIGQCGTMQTDWKNSTVTVWIWLGGADNLGKGYGTEAMKLLVNFIFSELDINRIQLYAFGFNKRAVKCYEKAGYQIEGIFKEDIFRNGKYNDTYILAILRQEHTLLSEVECNV